MIGNRIRLIRNAHSLSLQQLAENLDNHLGISISRSTLFSYENERTAITDQILESLSVELGVAKDFFFEEDWTDFSLDYFQSPPVVPQRLQQLEAYIQVKLERHKYLNHLLKIPTPQVVPKPILIDSTDYQLIENRVQELRDNWNLGIYPIASVCGLLESLGWYLLLTPSNVNREDNDTPEICGVEKSLNMPFILYKSSYFNDELRYKLLQNIGYAYIKCTSDDSKHLVQYFARALLFPSQQAISELGMHRTEVSEQELSLIKHKYGIPKRMIMLRLYELNIISSDYYNRFVNYLQQNLFLQRESLMESSTFLETPISYEMRLKRAESEKLIPRNSNNFFS
ncbi:DNA-binding helix-turn-helix protein [Clostridiales bacterium 1_7_47FAA]|uniref:XRE family transcriptional regulator n=1 Tax=Enterocloster hominis (ex Hitch et al. 2024) TaxID=1917870 RepID=A0ABV1DDC1_9FIRM|nr:DNA-binding helix-turn-helix protein [Clostridiales bacterium 1_7_47FAA]